MAAPARLHVPAKVPMRTRAPPHLLQLSVERQVPSFLRDPGLLQTSSKKAGAADLGVVDRAKLSSSVSKTSEYSRGRRGRRARRRRRPLRARRNASPSSTVHQAASRRCGRSALVGRPAGSPEATS